MIETLRIVNQMQADGVIGKYAIGGAIGAAFYLEPTSSLDIDIFISFEGMSGNPLAPLQGIYDYLREHGGETRREHILLEGWLIQFLPAEDALHREALAAAVATEVRGVTTWVMSAEHLIAIALKLGRRKDEARVERFVEIGKFDPRILGDILKRHDLLAKWREICDDGGGRNQ
jgi:hypothetical protein